MGGLRAGAGEALMKSAGSISGWAWAARLTQASRVLACSAMGMHKSQDMQLSMPASTCASIGQSAGMAPATPAAEPLVAI